MPKRPKSSLFLQMSSRIVESVINRADHRCSIAMQTNQDDIQLEQEIQRKNQRAKWAANFRKRYSKLTPEQKEERNRKRRTRQMNKALEAAAGGTGDPENDMEAANLYLKKLNEVKAKKERDRYHQLTPEQRKTKNQRRAELYRRRKIEDEMLLSMPIEEITEICLDRVHRLRSGCQGRRQQEDFNLPDEEEFDDDDDEEEEEYYYEEL